MTVCELIEQLSKLPKSRQNEEIRIKVWSEVKENYIFAHSDIVEEVTTIYLTCSED